MELVSKDEKFDYYKADNGVIYKIKKNGIDPYDWSWRYKRKFDKIDKDKQDELKTKQYNYLGKDKARDLRSKLKSKDLRRWGYDG